MEGRSPPEPVLLFGPEELDSWSWCLLEDGGGERRGTMGAGSHSGNVGCVAGLDSSSRSRESSCTTTSATSTASSVSPAACGASSHTDAVTE